MTSAKKPTDPVKTDDQDDAQSPIVAEDEQSSAPETESTTDDSSDDLVIVTFSEQWALYSAGETAGFPADKAAWLISRKIAVKA